MRSSVIPAGEHVPTADQRVVMNPVSWVHFEAILRARGDTSGPRMAFLDGALELMSPSKTHERIKSMIGCLIEAYAMETGIDLMPYGSWTLKKRAQKAGAEPDECYIVGTEQDKPSPDLAIEVVWTSGGLDKLEIYRRLEVGEVWTWIDGQIRVHLLRHGRYQRAVRSGLFPELDLPLLTSFLDQPTMNRAVRAYREALANSKSPPRRKR